MNIGDINAQALERGRKALLPGALPKQTPEHLLFVTISGAHLYGFPSADSDIDLRGTHVLTIRDVIGLRDPAETYESSGGYVDGIEVDCVTHDLRKYLLLLTKKNGYVLEQIFSPLVVHDGGTLQELRSLARGAMTRHVVHHYKGFFHTQEKLVMKDAAPTVKAVLYLFRVVMTGLHLLRTGEVEANIVKLNDSIYHFPYIPDLVARKMAGREKGSLQARELESLLDQARALEAQLDDASFKSALPDEVQNYAALDDFLIRMRKSFGE